MSFFGNGGQGEEIWSMAGINFGSNLTDILERDDFTLEEILVEDDLLQEIKSRNPVLLDFLSSPEIVQTMVRYVTFPPEKGSPDEVMYKYPYMSCEVFCSEVPSILHVLVEQDGGRYLTLLLSALDSPLPLDHYLAGYFEKILDMLFRQMTIPIMKYLNKGGIHIFRKLLGHVDNYSIMQIVQRLMLPHIPFSLETSDVDTMTQEQRENCTCDWSFLPETCSLLITKMLEGGCHADIPAHISELLITVIQLSPPDAPFLSNLCEEKCLTSLVSYIWDPNEPVSADSFDDAAVLTAKSLAVASVLDSLMSRMCEAYDPSFVALAEGEVGSPSRARSSSHGSADSASNPVLIAAARIAEGNMSGEFSSMSDAAFHQQIQQRVRENMGYICHDIMGMIPKLANILKSHLKDSSAILKNVEKAEIAGSSDTSGDAAAMDGSSSTIEQIDVPPPAGFIMHQTKFPFPRLGHHGFRLVKLTESIVRLADPVVDEALVSSGALEACIRLMFQYELHSLLHLSVQRIAVMILEGGENRRLAQKNILIDAGLMDFIINSFVRDKSEDSWNGSSNRFAHCGKPVMGHVIYIAQILVRTLHIETPEGIKEARDNLDDSMMSAVTTDGQDGSGRAGSTGNNDDIWSVVEGTAQLGHLVFPKSIPATLMRSIIEDAGMAEKWDSFVDNEYKRATDLQLTGATDSNVSVYSASDAGASPDSDDPSHAHIENALRALAGYSGYDGNLANRWPATDSDFVIINEEEVYDDDDDDDDYPYDWNSNKQGMHSFSQGRKYNQSFPIHREGKNGAVMVEFGNGHQNFANDEGSDEEDDANDTGSWTKVSNNGKKTSEEDLFGPSTNNVDIFASDGGSTSAGADFFAASPQSIGSSPSSAGGDFFADFGSPPSSMAAPAAEGEDFFASMSGAPNSSDGLAETDFFAGNNNSAFSFSSQPAPVGSNVQPTTTSDEVSKGDF